MTAFRAIASSLIGPVACLAATLVAIGPAPAQRTGLLIPRPLAGQLGLERAWFSQIQIDPSHSQIVNWHLSGDALFAVTNAGIVHALDAETGETLWISQAGNPHYPSLGPSVNGEYVAIVNGSTLYLLNRQTGRLVTQRRLGSAPGSAPILAGGHVYVPLVNGRLEGYSLENPAAPPWSYQSYGRTLVRPVATGNTVVWSTDAGYLYGGGTVEPGIRFRMDSPAPFEAPAAVGASTIFAVSLRGDLYAIDEINGTQIWRYSAGYPADRTPAVIGDRVYFSTLEPTLHCVDSSTGKAIWQVRDVAQFAAATSSRVYGLDRFGGLIVIDFESGAVLARIPSQGQLTALVNDQTDRLFLVSAGGLVQCLYETGADEPTFYQQQPAAAAPADDSDADPDGAPVDEPVAPAEDEPVAPQPIDGFDDPPDEATPPAEEDVGDFGFGDDDEIENPFE